MSDANLRELERRAYDSEEDFLRYSAARLRAGLGPVTIIAPVSHGYLAQDTLIYLTRRDRGWAVFKNYEADVRPASVQKYGNAAMWGIIGFKGGHEGLPEEADVLYSLASLAQHGRTSTTLPALIKLTGRPRAHVEAVLRALAQRGAITTRGPLVVFDKRIVALVVGGPAVRKAANPSADERLRALQRAAKAGDPEAAERLAHERRRMTNVKLTIQRLRDTDEWRVNVWINGKRDDGKSYYTDDKQDAKDTAALMQRQIDEGNPDFLGLSGLGRSENPSPDERRRALQRQAQRELDTYGESAPDTLDRLTADAKRTEVPKLGDRAYLRDIAAAWGLGGKSNWIPSGVASKALQAVFKKAGIKATFRTNSYSGGSDITIRVEDQANAEKMARLFGYDDRPPPYRTDRSVYVNAREDKSDSYTDYWSPGGMTLPAEYYQTYAEAIQKAMGSKKTAEEKRAAKRETKAAEKASATTLDETYGAPVDGKRYYFDSHGSGGGVWQAGEASEVSGRGTIYRFTRVGKRGDLLSWKSSDNMQWLSERQWNAALKAGVVKYGPTSNPGMATLGWATNPGKGLSLAQARKRIDKTDPATLIAQTRPRDRDKLKAEIAHASRSKNPGSTASVGRQKGGAWKTVSIETAIGRYKIDKIPSFKKALAHYRKFHKADPHSVRICVRQNDDGKNKQMVVTDMGEVPETQYIVKDGKDSNKAGHHWVHKHREKGKGTNPQLVFDPVSGTMMIVGGTYKVTDWIRN